MKAQILNLLKVTKSALSFENIAHKVVPLL